jgi:hypothetical protein
MIDFLENLKEQFISGEEVFPEKPSENWFWRLLDKIRKPPSYTFFKYRDLFLLGPRRSGKTTFIRSIIDHYLQFKTSIALVAPNRGFHITSSTGVRIPVIGNSYELKGRLYDLILVEEAAFIKESLLKEVISHSESRKLFVSSPKVVNYWIDSKGRVKTGCLFFDLWNSYPANKFSLGGKFLIKNYRDFVTDLKDDVVQTEIYGQWVLQEKDCQ